MKWDVNIAIRNLFSIDRLEKRISGSWERLQSSSLNLFMKIAIGGGLGNLARIFQLFLLIFLNQIVCFLYFFRGGGGGMGGYQLFKN